MDAYDVDALGVCNSSKHWKPSPSHRQKPTGAALRLGVGAADCDNQPEIVPSTHPPPESVHPTAPRS